MKIRLLPSFIFSIGVMSVFFSCENRKAEETKAPVPQVFTPQADDDSLDQNTDSLVQQNGTQIETPDTTAEAKVKRESMPSVAELKKITPSQEAKRALSNDAMQIYRMKPEAFFKFMKSRIPYYRGKGNLKTENDMLRIEITEQEMTIETPQGRERFSMQ